MPETSTTQQGFIFDLDGVVVDTFKYHYQAWRRVADSLGIEFTEAQHHGLQGIGRMASLEKILDHGNIYLPDAEKLHWADVKNNWYVELVAHMTPAEVLPGVREFLEEIKDQNYRTALVSSSRNAGAVLQSTHLDHLFDAVVDGNVIKKPKPDPERYLLAAQSLQLAPAQCTVFEDTLAGVFGAAHSGFFVVGIGKPEQLLYAHCVIPGFTNLTLAELQSKTERVCS